MINKMEGMNCIREVNVLFEGRGYCSPFSNFSRLFSFAQLKSGSRMYGRISRFFSLFSILPNVLPWQRTNLPLKW